MIISLRIFISIKIIGRCASQIKMNATDKLTTNYMVNNSGLVSFILLMHVPNQLISISFECVHVLVHLFQFGWHTASICLYPLNIVPVHLCINLYTPSQPEDDIFFFVFTFNSFFALSKAHFEIQQLFMQLLFSCRFIQN